MTETSELQLHQRLRELLPSAQAETCRVITTFLDVRGFSTFSEKGESFDAATYLSSFYSTVLAVSIHGVPGLGRQLTAGSGGSQGFPSMTARTASSAAVP